MRRFLIAFFLLLALAPAAGYAQTDTTAKQAEVKPPPMIVGHQLRFSFDISRPIINLTQETKKSYEGGIDYYIRNEVYGVLEGGAGSSVYEYPDLSYRSSNSFVRVGIDKTLIKRLNNHDWDAAFIGTRYGLAFINRQEASYVITDSLWGTTSGKIPASTFTAHWIEVTGGVRVEILPRIMAGWNLRAKFLLNEKAFRELSPVFIAGYGKGDKTTVFDFNFYLCYALRWGRAETR